MFWTKLGFRAPLNKASAFAERPEWQNKQISFDQVSEKIPDGSRIYIGSTSATAHATLNALVNGDRQIRDINILQFIPGGELPHLEEHTSRIRTTAFFAYGQAARKIREGIADYLPVSTGRIHRLIKEKRLPIEVAIIKTTPPDNSGYLNLGTGVDFSNEAIEAADIVIAEVCEHMPWTKGSSLVHSSQITWWTENHSAIPTTEELFPWLGEWQTDKAIMEKIAENIIFEIPDGATIKMDATALINDLVPYLSRRKNLGLHTDILTDQLLSLIKSGVITNANKNVNTGKSIVCHAYGSKDLYEYVNRNADIEFQPAYLVNRLDRLAHNNNLISVVSGLKVDLSGQVAVDSVGNRFYAGIGSSDDSIKAAGYSHGGKPIVALPSQSIKGNSNILLALPEGTGVVITRYDVHYVITEYGTAFLFGKTIRERCLALIKIAHPRFRESLLQQAKEKFLIHPQQPGHSFKSEYPKRFECHHQTTKDKRIFVRPIQAVDEDLLRDFFHKLSDQNVYMRYFTQMRSLPQKVLKQYADIDYSKDMALVAVYPPETANHAIIGIAQWIMDDEDSTPEIAIQIRDDWQGHGLGRFFTCRLMTIAKEYGIKHLKADVLADNDGMNRIFESLDIDFKRKLEFGVYSYLFNLDK
ncbi:MAG: GNAT family N-acetyltransferase [Aestuariibacter sp.]